MTKPKAIRLVQGERGEGDDDIRVVRPRSATSMLRASRARAIVVQKRSASQPRITKRLISVNYTPGRKREIDQVTIHVTEGSATSVRSWFNNPAAQASAHYQVLKNGDIDQFVDEADTAWHNGRVRDAVAALVVERPGVNPNWFSIGIEHEGTGRDELTPAQRASTLWLIADIVRRRPLVKIDRRHIVGHHEVFSAKTCPGAIDVDKLVRELQPAIVSTDRPRVVWSAHFGDWLIVTRVVSDREWYYVQAKSLRDRAQQRAQTPLSQMPEHP